ncbi:hypothetical protein HAZT_HAZT006848 [Hyalella azteca]|uniref:Uncharacterized protein n=1 Tax=Hyalella azteca TaxID=294128 RepID=A0A6A0GRV3_HYAAZ|nr:hypothetical protein HAZT_HAZT006848 [Hyalella azteca]
MMIWRWWCNCKLQSLGSAPKLAGPKVTPLTASWQSTAAAPQSSTKTKPKSAPETSPSFVKNIFCGRLVTDQILPYPNVLTEEQTENLNMLIDPTEKFFQVSQPKRIFNQTAKVILSLVSYEATALQFALGFRKLEKEVQVFTAKHL